MHIQGVIGLPEYSTNLNSHIVATQLFRRPLGEAVHSGNEGERLAGKWVAFRAGHLPKG